MQVKLNAFRGDDRPGDIVDIPDSEAAELITHGAAFPVDDAAGADTAGEDDAQGDDAKTVSGEASLAATSETGTETETDAP